MLVVAGAVNYIDRATLAVANPLIRQELGLSIPEMGYLLSAFLWAYAFSQLPTGAMVDKLGPRRLLTAGLTLWSTGIAAAIPFACGVVGGISGGVSGRYPGAAGCLAGHNSRKYPAAIALLGTSACTVAAAYVTSNTLAVAFISASLFLVCVTSTCAWALSSVAAPTNCTASIGAMQNFGAYLGGALAPTVTGLIGGQRDRSYGRWWWGRSSGWRRRCLICSW